MPYGIHTVDSHSYPGSCPQVPASATRALDVDLRALDVDLRHEYR